MDFEKNSKGCIRFKDTSGITWNVWNKILNRFNWLGYGLPDVDFVKSYFDRGCYLQPDQSFEVLKIFGEEHDTELYTKEQIEVDNAKAKEHFGLTGRADLAGYLLTDGDMLNFSYDNYMRDIDHRDIKEVLECGDGYNDGLIQFVNYGNIRLLYNGFELSKAPNNAQRRILARIIRSSGQMYVDIVNNMGHEVKSLSYEYASPAEIFADIDDYFEAIA